MRTTTKKAPSSAPLGELPPTAGDPSDELPAELPVAPEAGRKTAKRAPRKKAAASPNPDPVDTAATTLPPPVTPPVAAPVAAGSAPVLFQPPDPAAAPAPRRRSRAARPDIADATDLDEAVATDRDGGNQGDTEAEDAEESETGSRRRRRRGGRRRRKSAGEPGADDTTDEPTPEPATAAEPTLELAEAAEPVDDSAADEEAPSEGGTRRRRRRRRRGEGTEPAGDDPANTVVRVREPRSAEDEVTSIAGSTRLEAKKQRRREGREAGRRRAPIVSEAEFLARRESVDREMVIRQHDDVAQIAVLEDGVLVEHYVARESQTSLIGNVYLGRVQNVLPSMEAAFVDIGKGRNAVLYAGEVDWKALGAEGKPRRVEEALKSGQTVLVQVTKDPVGHKGARLTSQISLPGRFLVYVPGGQTSGISRKLPDTERNRLKNLLKTILPEEAGVIIRTAAEGATEEQLTRDVSALTARWDDITAKVKTGSAPALLYGEPDLMIKVVRDLFNEDFGSLQVQGADAWDMIEAYVNHVAPDLAERASRWGDDSGDHRDVFAAHRIDEQIAKGLDRKVWLPSGGSLVIDRTEAMTVVDVNTGKFTGSGGNLEETVTKNNLEAVEEIVRQLRLRDIGGIIVIDFIDMVLESNRDLVLRRLVECLGRDRTRHQVAEVTSLGLVQMTRKRIGTGLLEAFSESCEHCLGRGVVVHTEPVEVRKRADGVSGESDEGRRGRRGRGPAVVPVEAETPLDPVDPVDAVDADDIPALLADEAVVEMSAEGRRGRSRGRRTSRARQPAVLTGPEAGP